MFSHLLPATFKEEVIRWIKEDCPTTDVGGFVVGEKIETAYLYCKSDAVLAAVPFANAVLDFFSLKYNWLFDEGVKISLNKESALPYNLLEDHRGKDIYETSSGKIVVAVIEGKCRDILLAERTCLNIMSRASGVATASKKACSIKNEKNWHGFVAGTRKTTPGFKNVEKYALVVGGAATHRLDLSQMVMLKDNHIWSAGSITNAVKKARSAGGFSIKIEVKFSISFEK